MLTTRDDHFISSRPQEFAGFVLQERPLDFCKYVCIHIRARIRAYYSGQLPFRQPSLLAVWEEISYVCRSQLTQQKPEPQRLAYQNILYPSAMAGESQPPAWNRLVMIMQRVACTLGSTPQPVLLLRCARSPWFYRRSRSWGSRCGSRTVSRFPVILASRLAELSGIICRVICLLQVASNLK